MRFKLLESALFKRVVGLRGWKFWQRHRLTFGSLLVTFIFFLVDVMNFTSKTFFLSKGLNEQLFTFAVSYVPGSTLILSI